MDDLLSEFLTETNESIDVVDVELVRLERNPNDKEVLDNIFRLVHTIKGTCGFLGLPRLESVAHSGENVLGKYRDGELEVTQGSVTLILASLDRIKEILTGLEETGNEPDGDDSDLIGKLDAVAEGAEADVSGLEVSMPSASVDPDPTPESEPDMDDGVDASLGRALKPGEVSLDELEAAFASAPGPEELGATDEVGSVSASSDGSVEERLKEVGNEAGLIGAFESVLEQLAQSNANKDLSRLEDVSELADTLGKLTAASFAGDSANAKSLAVVAEKVITWDIGFLAKICSGLDRELSSFGAAESLVSDLQSALERQGHILIPTAQSDAKSKSGDQQGQKARSNQTVRVNLDLLEDLMNLVSELVLTRNQLNQMVRHMEDSEFAVPLQRLSQCTTELQEGVMKTRMQPIGNAWSKLPRIVRDLSLELDKQIELEMHGQDTELDRQVLELIKDPLTHMVRNSADHGVEMPSDRTAAGKPEQGVIKLNAYHEGGHIVITIADDGAGINADRLKAKALENGLATEAELDAMSENQIQKYIFHAGLSTAQEVTSVSGRGVGMDVVRTNIEKIGGTIDMTSTMGKGTTFYIKIPLTLAIVSALIVEAADQRFAIPQISVLELVRANQTGDMSIEHINETPVFRLRNGLLPLIYLRDILGYPRPEEEQGAFIVVTQVGNFTFGVVVDQVFDTEEIVVKPVAPVLSDLPVYSGNTILGDGSVIMILDPNGVASQVSTAVTDSDQVEDDDAARAAASEERETMLVFRAASETPKAVPLSLVARLEEIEIERIENRETRPMVQYRGQLMPILTMSEDMKLVEEGNQPILVFADGERTMGIAVEEILDIVEQDLNIEVNTDREGVVGTAVIAGKVSEIIDVSHYSKQAFKDWFDRAQRKDDRTSKKAKVPHVLVVEDSAFFRNMLRPLLTAAGYQVTIANDAEEALELRERHNEYDLIVSDIEMPGLNGFELAEALRRSGKWQKTPMIALSSLGTAKDFEKGRDAGFNDYVVKLDREALLETMSEQLQAMNTSDAA